MNLLLICDTMQELQKVFWKATRSSELKSLFLKLFNNMQSLTRQEALCHFYHYWYYYIIDLIEASWLSNESFVSQIENEIDDLIESNTPIHFDTIETLIIKQLQTI